MRSSSLKCGSSTADTATCRHAARHRGVVVQNRKPQSSEAQEGSFFNEHAVACIRDVRLRPSAQSPTERCNSQFKNEQSGRT